MKKSLIILAILAMLLTGAGCAAAGPAPAAAEGRIEEKPDAAEDSAEQSLRRAAPPVPAETSVASDPITREKAEEIALKYLDLTKSQVKRLRSSYGIDDGIGQYDVEFTAGDYEYEFEIHAETGKILSFDKDHIHD